MEKIQFRQILLIIYYLFLFLLETPLMGSVGVPSAFVRILYIILLVAPICMYDKYYLPFVVLASYSISKFGTAVTLMPTEVWYYVPLFVFFAAPSKFAGDRYLKIPSIIIVLCASVLFVDFITSQTLQDDFICLLILILFFFYCIPRIDSEFYFNCFSHTFIVIALILSLELIFAGNQYVQSYGYTDMERAIWADPNYLGGVMGMGVMAAAVLYIRKCAFSLKVYLLSSIMLMITALVLNASRGALLATISGVFVILMMGKRIKIWQRALLLSVAAVFVIFLYNNSYFELLEYRLENDSGGGSGRTGIWLIKLDEFFKNSNLFQLIFGRGYDGGLKAGFSYNRAFHNDFIAFLVEYGFIGFVSFVTLMLYPLKRVWFKDKGVLGCMVFIFVNCMTLEPFSLGMLIYYFFWLYVYYQSMRYKTNNYSLISRKI